MRKRKAAPSWRDDRSVGLVATGIALPGDPVTTHELLELLHTRFGIDMRRQGRALAARLGIHTRHFCRDFAQPLESPRSFDSNAQLAARAVSAALEEAGMEAADLDYLIAHTATPGRPLPPNVAQVVELLGYQGPYVELRQACTGFANALVMAFGLLHRSGCGPVAIVGSEAGSVFFNPLRVVEDSGQFVNFLQMGDAAAACILAPPEITGAAQLRKLYFGHDGNGSAAAFAMRGGGSDDVEDELDFIEFEHDYRSVSQHGPALFRRASEAAVSAGIDVRSARYVIPHQASASIATLLATHLGTCASRIFINADRVGNTGSAAIWLALSQLRSQLERGESVCVLGAEATKYMYGGFEYIHA